MQEENLKIVNPLVTYMEHVMGWYCKKIHGSQFQSGLPDLACWHTKYDMRWIECKVIRNGDFSFTPDQEREFPKLIAHGAKIWLIAGVEFRFTHGGEAALKRAYNSLFEPPNLHLYLNPRVRRLMLR